METTMPCERNLSTGAFKGIESAYGDPNSVILGLENVIHKHSLIFSAACIVGEHL